jgi:hypothetical protein
MKAIKTENVKINSFVAVPAGWSSDWNRKMIYENGIVLKIGKSSKTKKPMAEVKYWLHLSENKTIIQNFFIEDLKQFDAHLHFSSIVSEEEAINIIKSKLGIE